MTKNQDTEIIGLFGSETRAKLLKILVLKSQNSFRLTDLAKQTELDAAGIHRELSNLIALKIINVIDKNKNPEYKINKKHIFFNGLSDILKKSKLLEKKYFIFEELPLAYPFFCCDYINISMINNHLLESSLNSILSKSLSIYEYPNLRIFFIQEEFSELSKEILSRLIKNPMYGINDTKEVIKKIRI